MDWSHGPGVRRLAATTAIVDLADVVVIGIWLVSGELNAETLGEVILWASVAALAVVAVAEIDVARREPE